MTRASLLGALGALLLASSTFAQSGSWTEEDCRRHQDAQRPVAPERSLAEMAGTIGLSELPPVGSVGLDGIDFGTVGHGGAEARRVRLENESARPLTVSNAVLFGSGAGHFQVNFQGRSTPLVLSPGEVAELEVLFQPKGMGGQGAKLAIVHDGVPARHLGPTVELFGIGLGEPGADLLVNCGGFPRMSPKGEIWTSDLGARRGRVWRPETPPTGSADDELFHSLRAGRRVDYALELPNGEYEVTLYYATGAGAAVPPGRPYGIVLEDKLAHSAGHEHDHGGGSAHSSVLPVTIADGVLNMTAVSPTAGTWIGMAGIEVRLAPTDPLTPFLSVLDVSPADLDFGFLEPGNSLALELELRNTSERALNLTSAGFLVGASGGSAPEFTLDLGGTLYPGLSDNTKFPVSLVLRPGQRTTATVTFTPSLYQINDLLLVLEGNFKTVRIPVLGTGGVDTVSFLHVVIQDPGTLVDYDGDNSEMVTLDGTFSHTHYPGGNLIDFTWKEGQTVLGNGVVINVPLAKGTHEICLTITDDNVPAGQLTDCQTVRVVSAADVPGVLALYYEPDGVTPVQMLTQALPDPSFGEIRPTTEVADEGNVGGSPFPGNVLVRLLTGFVIDTTGPYQFDTLGGADHRLRVNSTPITSSSQVIQLSAGRHTLEARFAVNDINDLPLDVLMAPQGGSFAPIPSDNLNHDQTALDPVINSAPVDGGLAGGDPITITGLGFFPPGQTSVNWGGVTLNDNDFTSITPYQIEFDSPPGVAGPINVSISTPQGTSNQVSFLYKSLFIPVDFTTLFTSANVPQATCGDWGPDGRFYVAMRDGKIKAIEFDENYNVLSETSYDGVSNLSNEEILGIAFNPYDPPSPVKVYVGHGELYAQGGGSFSGPSPYTGEVSILTGPNFDTPTPYITGLPVSNHDHSVNGMQFDHNGDLLIAIGGNTNAGVAAPAMGDVPESPLSAAIVKALTSKPGFNGAVTYVETVSGTPNADQVDGEIVDVAPGVDVEVQAHGVRNAYDIVYTLDGRLYATSNGPNSPYGPASTGPTTDAGGNGPTEPDRLDLIEYDNYYGHPNRSRGRTDSRQNIFQSITEPAIPGEYSAPLEVLSSSTDGICEYRAATFGGKMQGELLTQRWWGQVRRYRLDDDGRSVSVSDDLQNLIALDVQVGPGGVIMGVDYSGGKVKVMIPNDSGAIGNTAYDIFPNRAPSGGGQPFVIGGSGFGTLGNTTVTIGGNPATLTSVTSKRIEGTIPADLSPTQELVDVVVTVSGTPSIIQDGFRYLFPSPGMEPGRWEDLTDLPVALGEVAAGVIDGVIYLVGEGSDDTFAYDIRTKAWDDTLADRPLHGHHHAAEVYNGKWYLFGGIDHGSEGQVQIYDPVLDTWSLGTPMPWAGGSSSSCIIDGKIYVAGGIVGGATVDDHAVYDPDLDSWTPLADMPVKRNHAASISDGERFWIFGGRQGGNFVTNGFDDVQVYDPITDTWDWDKDVGSSLVAMPQARGGTGKAVWYRGEFYVMGGETVNGGGAVAGNVYDRVDVYDPETNTWRLDAPMAVPRHGHFPVLYQSRMFLPGGGTQAANSQSIFVDAFSRQ